MTYLDWAATAPPDPEVLDEQRRTALSFPGNPSSRHEAGAAARAALEAARTRLARALRLSAKGVHFVSGGSEADAIPLLALLRKKNPGSIVVSSIEHAAVYEQARVLERLGWKLREVPPDPDGRVSPDKVAEAVAPDTALVACMAVNNETGATQPVREIAAAVRLTAKGRIPRFHVDAVQALGKIELGGDGFGADSLAFSAHKIGGPRGTGVLWLRSPVEPLQSGGGQEGGIRPGTENLPGDAAFALAAEKAVAGLQAAREGAEALEDALLEGLKAIPDATPLPLSRVPRDSRWSPWIVSFALPGLAGETAVRALSDSGFAVSTGSACSSASRERRVLDSMGVDRELSFSALRASFGPESTRAELDAFLEAVASIYRRFKA
ncbi:MAG: cysteine desulfurase [Spirochaetales bacterium]|nr:cysteine desulfurase [Spirochaetales bacterium]